MGLCAARRRVCQSLEIEPIFCVSAIVPILPLTHSIGTYRIPTWSTPFIALILAVALSPHVSILGHCCSLAVGYACKFEPLRAEPMRLDPY